MRQRQHVFSRTACRSENPRGRSLRPIRSRAKAPAWPSALHRRPGRHQGSAARAKRPLRRAGTRRHETDDAGRDITARPPQNRRQDPRVVVGHGIASRDAFREARARLVCEPPGAEGRIVRRSRRAPRVGRLPRQPRTRKVASGRTIRLCRRGRDQRHRTRHHA